MSNSPIEIAVLNPHFPYVPAPDVTPDGAIGRKIDDLFGQARFYCSSYLWLKNRRRVLL